MFINEIHIDGFGPLYNTGLTELPKGLVVVLGQNETGKSTLLSFVRYSFYDYGRKHVNKYPPLQGGSHGGRIIVISDSGDKFQIDQKEGKPFKFKHISENSKVQSVDELTGHLSLSLFENIYAFSISELISIDSLTSQELKDSLFSASMGANKYRQAIERIKELKGQLFKKTGRKPLINVKIAEIVKLDKKINDLSIDSDQYDELIVKKQKIERQINEKQRSMKEYREKLNEYTFLKNCLPIYEKIKKLNFTLDSFDDVVKMATNEKIKQIEELFQHKKSFKEKRKEQSEDLRVTNENLENIKPNEELLKLKDQIDKLNKEEGKYKTNLDSLITIRKQIDENECLISEGLEKLGFGWDKDRVKKAVFPPDTGEYINKLKGNLITIDTNINNQNNRLEEIKKAISDTQKELDELKDNISKLPEERSGEDKKLYFYVKNEFTNFKRNCEEFEENKVDLLAIERKIIGEIQKLKKFYTKSLPDEFTALENRQANFELWSFLNKHLPFMRKSEYADLIKIKKKIDSDFSETLEELKQKKSQIENKEKEVKGLEAKIRRDTKYEILANEDLYQEIKANLPVSEKNYEKLKHITEKIRKQKEEISGILKDCDSKLSSEELGNFEIDIIKSKYEDLIDKHGKLDRNQNEVLSKLEYSKKRISELKISSNKGREELNSIELPANTSKEKIETNLETGRKLREQIIKQTDNKSCLRNAEERISYKENDRKKLIDNLRERKEQFYNFSSTTAIVIGVILGFLGISSNNLSFLAVIGGILILSGVILLTVVKKKECNKDFYSDNIEYLELQKEIKILSDNKNELEKENKNNTGLIDNMNKELGFPESPEIGKMDIYIEKQIQILNKIPIREKVMAKIKDIDEKIRECSDELAENEKQANIFEERLAEINNEKEKLISSIKLSDDVDIHQLRGVIEKIQKAKNLIKQNGIDQSEADVLQEQLYDYRKLIINGISEAKISDETPFDEVFEFAKSIIEDFTTLKNEVEEQKSLIGKIRVIKSQLQKAVSEKKKLVNNFNEVEKQKNEFYEEWSLWMKSRQLNPEISEDDLLNITDLKKWIYDQTNSHDKSFRNYTKLKKAIEDFCRKIKENADLASFADMESNILIDRVENWLKIQEQVDKNIRKRQELSKEITERKKLISKNSEDRKGIEGIILKHKEEKEALLNKYREWLINNGLSSTADIEKVLEKIEFIKGLKNKILEVEESFDKQEKVEEEISDFTEIVRHVSKQLNSGYPQDKDILDFLTDIFEEYEKAKKAQTQLVMLKKESENKIKKINETDNELKKTSEEFLKELSSLGLKDYYEFKVFESQHKEFESFRNSEKEQIESLRSLCGERNYKEVLNKLEEKSHAELEMKKEELTKKIKQIEDELGLKDHNNDSEQGLLGIRGNIEQKLESIKKTDERSRLQQEKEQLIAEIKELGEKWVKYVIAKKLLDESRKEFEQSTQPKILQYASHYLKQFTSGVYTNISQDFESTNNKNQLIVETRKRKHKKIDELSTGTREQLYLALRLGYIEHRKETSETIPVIMDDIIVNFDAERARKAAIAINNFAENQQIIYFTCHNHIHKLFKEIAPNAFYATLTDGKMLPDKSEFQNNYSQMRIICKVND